MIEYTLKIKLLSDALPGSGEGLGALINSDIVFDDLGFPGIPAKRIKGCLRESAEEVCEMLADCGAADTGILLEKTGDESDKQESFDIVDTLFGEPGMEMSAPIYFSNLTVGELEDNKEALAYFNREFPSILSAENVVGTFTYTRANTKIDEDTGTAEDGSLRTVRLIKKGMEFEGTLALEDYDKGYESLLAMACLNFRYFGTKRTRGFGHIECGLFKDNIKIDAAAVWGELCTS
ncbi:MAG: hypothetical protein GY765_25115 [bacterium]|nr:hypothetical protein [bacterium]